MMAYWTRFAASGDPGAWPAYTAEGDQRLRLADVVAPEPADPDARCGFWAGLFDTL